MGDRYPGYDVLAKRNSISWNDKTRAVVDQRLSIPPDQHRFFADDEWRTLKALCDRIIPQLSDRAAAPLAAMIDEKVFTNATDGYRDARLPPLGEAWRRGLAALNTEAETKHGRLFHALSAGEQDGLLAAAQKGLAVHDAWAGMPAELFFKKRAVHDIVAAYYAHPNAWNEIGFGGPAAPRGYVRMGADRRDPWEAAEARPGREDRARRENARVGRY
jgi:Gluconate 2-dehydrogenase subunit 3